MRKEQRGGEGGIKEKITFQVKETAGTKVWGNRHIHSFVQLFIQQTDIGWVLDTIFSAGDKTGSKIDKAPDGLMEFTL